MYITLSYAKDKRNKLGRNRAVYTMAMAASAVTKEQAPTCLNTSGKAGKPYIKPY
jgi:hypothetical protein